MQQYLYSHYLRIYILQKPDTKLTKFCFTNEILGFITTILNYSWIWNISNYIMYIMI